MNGTTYWSVRGVTMRQLERGPEMIRLVDARGKQHQVSGHDPSVIPLNEELGKLRFEVDAVCDATGHRIEVREGGGPVNLAASLALSVAALKKERDTLAQWKEGAMELEREWDLQALATLLGGVPALGQSCRKVIEHGVRKLHAEVMKRRAAMSDTAVETLGKQFANPQRPKK